MASIFRVTYGMRAAFRANSVGDDQAGGAIEAQIGELQVMIKVWRSSIENFHGVTSKQ